MDRTMLYLSLIEMDLNCLLIWGWKHCALACLQLTHQCSD